MSVIHDELWLFLCFQGNFIGESCGDVIIKEIKCAIISLIVFNDKSPQIYPSLERRFVRLCGVFKSPSNVVRKENKFYAK